MISELIGKDCCGAEKERETGRFVKLYFIQYIEIISMQKNVGVCLKCEPCDFPTIFADHNKPKPKYVVFNV